MAEVDDCIAFTFKDAAVSAGEVVRAAQFRSELAPHWKQYTWTVACADAAEGQALEIDAEAVGQLAEQFRYDHELIAAEEAERWLERRRISMEAFEGYFNRVYWWRQLRDKIPAHFVDFVLVSGVQLARLQTELFLSGVFAGLATALSRRLTTRTGGRERATTGQVQREREYFFERTALQPDRLPEWLASLGRNRDWFEGMLEMEASYRIGCESLLTPERLSRTLGAARLALTRLHVEEMEFDSADAAREAHLCVRDDGLTMEQVARESRFPYRRGEHLAEDLPEPLRQKLLSAGTDELVEPIADRGIFRLCRVLGKMEPTLDEATVKARVEKRLLDAHFTEAGSMAIGWGLG